ncbi:PGC-1 and ERR-induced regulator in muscle protein 1 isoform X1 [Cygnus olor]|uniref:PGC-1 and ERR-induced regulator in muscle protein 1 isoform X1 n=2 Tax=Cygnus olor TaxID=8869 RepID=UPI001ADE2DB5|nr:PGC-1 and ERR-induced regulator in muscle protein 1 isoform X1 [Cygnus olor]
MSHPHLLLISPKKTWMAGARGRGHAPPRMLVPPPHAPLSPAPSPCFAAAGMDNFEYSIQLNDRDWAEFLQAAEECDLAPASLATAEEQCLSDIEQGDGVPAPRSASVDGELAARPGSGPGAGRASCSPRGVPGADEDEADPCSASSFLRGSDQPGCLLPAPMPSAQGTQPPRPPAAESIPGQDAACEVAAPQMASGEGATTTSSSSSGAMEPAGHPAAPRAPVHGGDAGGEQPRASPVAAQAGAPDVSARKSLSAAACMEPGVQGPPPNLPPSPAPEAAPSCPARPPDPGQKAGPEPSSPEVVRPKVPAQTRKSRKQRGAGAAEVTPVDREPAGTPAQGSGAPTRAPSSSPLASRKSKGKEKAAKPAPMRLGSEEAAESKRSAASPGTDEGDVPTSIPPKQKAKEPGAQSPGKTRAPKLPKAGQAGGSGVRDNVPVILTTAAPDPPGEACREGKALRPQSVAVPAGDAARGGPGEEPAAEPPVEVSPPGSAAGGCARANSLDVTWPEMYDYLFCDSQGEEEAMGNSVEGEKTPLEREISLPELYEYFFNEPEGNRKKVKGKERKRKKLSSLDRDQQKEEPDLALVKEPQAATVPELYEHFFPDRPWNRGGWRGLFFTTPASEVKKAVGALRSFLQRPMHLGRGQVPVPPALARRGSGEPLALVPLGRGRGQAQPQALDMALALRGIPEAPLPLTHKDMCLVFCAFASWAVKTSDLQAPDAWKTMFLASFGTLSAIRYFRRQAREGRPRT